MINLFKKQKAKNFQPVFDKLNSAMTKAIIEEIHETFYTEVDRLLSEAKISKSLHTDKQELIDKAKRLKELGFAASKEVLEAESEIQRLGFIQSENNQKKELIDAINYFSLKYPMYKFITEESVKKICANYGLIYGEVQLYTGTIPEKNLKHMEEFSVLEKDDAYLQRYEFGGYRSNTVIQNIYYDRGTYKLQKQFHENDPRDDYGSMYHYTKRDFLKAPLEIAAPSKDFDLSKMEVNDFKIIKMEIPDPIVLKPVIFNGKKHYLIVTAWGLEASDELVMNPKHN